MRNTKRLSLLLVLLVLVSLNNAYGQFQNVIDYGPVHAKKLTKTVLVTSGVQSVIDKDSIWVQFPSRFNFNNTWKIDTLSIGETLVASGFDTLRDGIWSGFGEIDIKFTNVDLAHDSLQIMCYSVNKHGEVNTNDYVYLDFTTPPSYTTSANNLDWTDETTYRASISGAFGYGTQGLLFIVNGWDASTGKVAWLRFDVYLK